MLKNTDLIILSLMRWDAPYSSNSFSLAKEFAKNHRVFYIDHPFSLKDFICKFNEPAVRKRRNALLWGKNIYTKSEKFPKNLTMVTPRLTLPINFLPAGALYNRLSRINDNIIFNAIRQIIRDHKVKNFIFINGYDPFFCRDFPADIKPFKKVYQSVDDLTQATYTAKHGTRLEADIVKKYDITLTTSMELQRLKLKQSTNVHYHPNAADFNNFKTALSQKFPRPVELARAEGKKIIGYTGNIESRIDYELLKAVIEYHHDKMIVMVGPVTSDDHKTIGLSQYPNVIMTGGKKIDQLPAYLQYFDCALIPFKKNTLTRSIYPLKINEYLAAGRPVVSTNFSEDIESFKDVIHIGRDIAEFVQKIDVAIHEHSPERVQARIAVANSNTWSARVDRFWEIVEKVSARTETPIAA
jgi:teichuronic acid biosynthesis glycosyltransferase TuaH